MVSRGDLMPIITNLRKRGLTSLRQIGAALNERGVPAPGAAAEVADAATRKDEPPSTKGLWIINIIIGLLGGLLAARQWSRSLSSRHQLLFQRNPDPHPPIARPCRAGAVVGSSGYLVDDLLRRRRRGKLGSAMSPAIEDHVDKPASSTKTGRRRSAKASAWRRLLRACS